LKIDDKSPAAQKIVEDLKKQNREHEQTRAALPEQITQVLKDKSRLEQQVIDLEAMIRRFTSEKLKRDSENLVNPPNPLAAEENIFFFELLTQIVLQVPDTVDYRELRTKAEEGIAILERHRMIQLIPTVGHAFNDRQHKVVRSFQTGMLEDGTIIYEVNRGYSFGDQIVQRALVWIAKSRFKCHSCGAQARGPDNFCPKCGLELCTPDGISKRKLTPLPPTTEICLPLVDYYLEQRHFAKVEELLDYLPQEKQLLPATVKRRNRLVELKNTPVKEKT
ncbi:MAG TPA: nucleotide exchange factor GrpE, partial [Candidatus Ozemobacteraceae bacterium]|nr:nucleotide exchange factor GrpE [Candidatus Ozemobacteraceae bacterium]